MDNLEKRSDDKDDKKMDTSETINLVTSLKEIRKEDAYLDFQSHDNFTISLYKFMESIPDWVVQMNPYRKDYDKAMYHFNYYNDLPIDSCIKFLENHLAILLGLVMENNLQINNK